MADGTADTGYIRKREMIARFFAFYIDLNKRAISAEVKQTMMPITAVING